MRILFTTLQFKESEFYGRVAAELRSRGHDAAHVAFSRRAASGLRRQGFRAWCLADAIAELPKLSPAEIEHEADRIVDRYDTPTLRDIYRTDWPCDGMSEAQSVERTVRHFLALERVFDEWQPDVLIPELGSETMRTAAHLIAQGPRDRHAVSLPHALPGPGAPVLGLAARADRAAGGGASAPAAPSAPRSTRSWSASRPSASRSAATGRRA